MAAVVSVSPPSTTACFMAVARPVAPRRTCRTFAMVVRPSSVGSAVVGGRSPLAARRSGWRVAGWSACCGVSSSASRRPAAITASTGCCSMAQAAISATTHALMIASGSPCVVRESRMVSSRRCPAAATGVAHPNGSARIAAPMLLPSAACSSPVATKRRTAAWVVGPAPRIPGSAFASRPRKSRSSICPLASTRYSATSSSCAVSSDVAPRGQSPRAGSVSSASQRTSSGVLPSQGTPSASPAAYATMPARMCRGVAATPSGERRSDNTARPSISDKPRHGQDQHDSC
jgi:hypothetical protein